MIRYALEHENAKDPVHASVGAAGFDLYAAEIIRHDRENFWIETGVAFDIPNGIYGDLRARSSISELPIFLANGAGVLDSDYRGTIQFRFKYDEITGANCLRVPYHVGERVGQVIFTPYLEADLTRCDSLSDTERGEGGFGSTGEQ